MLLPAARVGPVVVGSGLGRLLDAGEPVGEGAAEDEGVKSAIPMRSKIGRVSWLADRTQGHQDAGATSFYLM